MPAEETAAAEAAEEAVVVEVGAEADPTPTLLPTIIVKRQLRQTKINKALSHTRRDLNIQTYQQEETPGVLSTGRKVGVLLIVPTPTSVNGPRSLRQGLPEMLASLAS